jgi:integrase
MRKGQASWDENRGYWCIKVQKDGIRRAFYSSVAGIKGKIEAENKADLWLEEKDTGKTIIEKQREQTLIKDLFQDFIKEKERFGEDFKQFKSYGNKRILPLIGEMQIRNLSEQDLQDIIHAANADGLAKKTQQNIRACLTSFLKYCRKRGCTKLYVEELKIHKDAPEYGKKSLQPNEVAYIFKNDLTLKKGVVEKDRYINAYRFGILTGLRTGEIIGLKWSDIDKDNNVLIKRSINKYNIETKGKNKNAQRRFKLIPKAIAVLADQRQLLKDEGIISEWVFPWTDGKYTTMDNLEKAWRRYVKYNNLSPVSLYEMSRHTFISVNKQMPLELLKLVAGHSESMDTTKIYAHMLEGDLDAAADLIDAKMSSIIDTADGGNA